MYCAHTVCIYSTGMCIGHQDMGSAKRKSMVVLSIQLASYINLHARANQQRLINQYQISFTLFMQYRTQENLSGLSPIQSYLKVLDFSIQTFHRFAHIDFQRIYPEGLFLLALQLQGISSCTAGMSKRVADNLVTSLVIPTSGGKKMAVLKRCSVCVFCRFSQKDLWLPQPDDCSAFF